MIVPVKHSQRRPRASQAIAALLLAASTMLVAGCGLPSFTETSWSPDDRTIAYVGDQDRLFLLDVATKQSRPVSSDETACFLPAYSPDGKTIAFYGATNSEKLGISLCALDLDSQQTRTLVADVWPVPEEPTAKGGTQGQASAQGPHGELDALVYVFALIYAGAITWSPDGKSLVCAAASKDKGQLLLVDPTAGTAKPIIEEPCVLAAPAWSPDGARLAYCVWPLGAESESGKQTGQTNAPVSLWVYDFASQTPIEVCDLPENGLLVADRLQWSADSRTLGFIADDPAKTGRAIGCLVEAQAGAAVRQEMKGITPTAAWAPGLKGIAFVEERSEGNSVVLYKGVSPPARKVLGSLRHPVTTETEERAEGGGTMTESRSTSISVPQFSPDGRLLCITLTDTTEKVTPQVYAMP